MLKHRDSLKGGHITGVVGVGVLTVSTHEATPSTTPKQCYKVGGVILYYSHLLHVQLGLLVTDIVTCHVRLVVINH